jgi:hypothetical protein
MFIVLCYLSDVVRYLNIFNTTEEIKLSVKQVVTSYLSNPKMIPSNIMYRMVNKPSSAKHIFVIGAPRSGTTLIQSVLSFNQQITSFDEETGFFMYRDLFSNRYENIEEKQFKKIVDESTDMVSLFDAISKCKIEISEHAVCFLEKTPQHVLYLSTLLKLFPNSKFINVYRDVRDSSLSALKFAGIEQGKDLETFVRYWQKCVKARLRVQSENILDVKYECFVSDPKNELIKVMRFLGIKFEEYQLSPENFSRNKRAGNVGFKKLANKIDGKSVRKWETEQSAENLNLIWKLAKKELNQLGYI